jgi:hypothetical protein
MSKYQPWHLGAQAAELYERYVARYILGPWTPLLVDAARLAEGEWRVGCSLRDWPRDSRCGNACRFRWTRCWCRPESRHDRRCAIAPGTDWRADRVA